MALRFSKRFGKARISVGSSGLGWSVGSKGMRVSHRAGSGRKQKKAGCLTQLIGWVFVAAILIVIGLAAWEIVKAYWPWILGGVIVVGLLAAGARLVIRRLESPDRPPRKIDL